MSDLGNRGDVDEGAARVGQAFDEDRLGAGIDLAFKARRIARIRPADLPVEGLEGMAELVDRAAVKPVGGNEVVARAHDRVEDEKLGRMPGGNRQRRSTAFERCEALFQHRLRRVHDAGVDVAELLQAEECRGMVGIVEDEAGRLVDRRRPGARRRIWLRSGVDCERAETRIVFRHSSLP
ncbi:hypothetical protein D3C72_1870780 [compost metagenome]